MFGKISMSLVVSILLATSAGAADVVIDDENTTGLFSNESISVEITPNGSIKMEDKSEDITAIDINTTLISGSDILNKGEIRVSTTDDDDYNATGIDVENNEAVISNSGNIDVNGSAHAVAIHIGRENKGSIVNDGNITSTDEGISLVDNSGSLINSGNITAHYGVVAGNNSGKIENSGNIRNGEKGFDIASNSGTIINSGTIEQMVNGIKVRLNSSGTVENKGTIQESNRGINVIQNFGNVLNSAVIKNCRQGMFVGENSGSVFNNSSINAEDGLIVDRNNGVVENRGTIQASGYGIDIRENNGEVKNSGNISTNIFFFGLGSAVHIYNQSGKFINSGTIHTQMFGIYTNNNSGIVENSGTIVVEENDFMFLPASGMDISNNEGTALNSGTIISIFNGMFGRVAASGIMKNSGTITAEMNGMESSYNSGIVANSGTITSNDTGIFVYSNDGMLQNSGTITARKNGINSHANSGTIENSGVINAEVGIKTSINDGGRVVNNGIINASRYAIMSGVGDNDSLSLVVNNGTTYGSYNTIGANLENNGNITLNTNDQINTKNYRQSADGMLTMIVESDAQETKVASIHADGNVSIEDGSSLYFHTAAPKGVRITQWYSSLQDSKITKGYKEFNGDEGVVITGDNIDINVSKLNIEDSSTLFEYSLEKDGNNSVNLIVSKAASPFGSFLRSNHLSGTAAGAAGALDRVFAKDSAMNGDIEDFMTGFEALGSTEQKSNALLSLTPSSTSASSHATMQMMNSMSGVVQARASSARGMSSGDALFRDKNIWIKPFGSYTRQNNESGIKGFQARSKGVSMGIDGALDDGKRVGVSLFATDTSVDTNDIAQSNDMKSYSLIAYGSLPLFDSKTLCYYQIGGGIQRNSSSRYIMVADTTATASYTSKTFMVSARVERNFNLAEGLRVIPAIEGAYRYFSNPTYSEVGAGGLGLNVNALHDHETVVGVGGSLAYSLASKTELYAGAMAHYDLADHTNSVTASYEGAADVVFSSNGIDNASMLYSANAGLHQELAKGFSLNIDYGLSRKTSGFTNHTLSAKLNLNLQ